MPYDLNGRLEQRSRMSRLLRRSVDELTHDDPELVPVAGSDDDAVASSAVLDGADGFDPEAQSVLLHVLELPPDSVGEVLRLVGQDRYERVPVSVTDEVGVTNPEARSDGRGREGLEAVAVARVQRIDALHVSQERSRMAGVTARHGGRALSWTVLQVPS